MDWTRSKIDERAGPQEDDLAGEVVELLGRVGPGGVAGHVEVALAVLEGEHFGDVGRLVLLLPVLGVAEGAVVVPPGVRLPAVVAGDLARRGCRARFPAGSWTRIVLWAMVRRW